MARILVGVSGGIAAYKAVELVRLATGAGHAVRVVQTPASLQFVGRATFEGVTGAPVLVDEFERDPARGAYPGEPAPSHDPISHLELVRRADVFCVAPASANTIAKLAHGLADNLLTSAALASTAPLVVAPAMNNHMYEHPATQDNLALLRARGATIVEPDTGRLASRGEWGVGRLADPPRILETVEGLLGKAGGPMDGLRVLVTAGGTREPIDSVRYVGNRSSGRMGLALAAEAARRGAEVTAGRRQRGAARAGRRAGGRGRRRPPSCSRRRAAAFARRARAADGRGGGRLPARARRSTDKISKSGRDGLALALEPTEDVLAALAGGARARARRWSASPPSTARAPSSAAARSSSARASTRSSSTTSRAPRSASTRPTTRSRSSPRAGERHVPLGSKEAVAAAILDAVEGLRKPARPAAQGDEYR